MGQLPINQMTGRISNRVSNRHRSVKTGTLNSNINMDSESSISENYDNDIIKEEDQFENPDDSNEQ